MTRCFLVNFMRLKTQLNYNTSENFRGTKRNRDWTPEKVLQRPGPETKSWGQVLIQFLVPEPETRTWTYDSCRGSGRWSLALRVNGGGIAQASRTRRRKKAKHKYRASSYNIYNRRWKILVSVFSLEDRGSSRPTRRRLQSLPRPHHPRLHLGKQHSN